MEFHIINLHNVIKLEPCGNVMSSKKLGNLREVCWRKNETYKYYFRISVKLQSKSSFTYESHAMLETFPIVPLKLE